MGYIKKATRKKVYKKCNGHCAYCGTELPYDEMQVDHFFPQRKAHFLESEVMREEVPVDDDLEDVDQFSNLMPACARCNRWKSSFDIEQFREQVAAQVERVKRDKAGFRLALDFGLIEPTNNDVVFYFEEQSKCV